MEFSYFRILPRPYRCHYSASGLVDLLGCMSEVRKYGFEPVTIEPMTVFEVLLIVSTVSPPKFAT
jgi:hypothetical protein